MVLCIVASSRLALPAISAAEGHEFEGIPIVAHRGAGFELDENTLEACKRSYEGGFRGFEVDFRITKDGHLLLSHDDTLERMFGHKGRVEEMTLAEVKALKTRKGGFAAPTVEELFGYFKDKHDVFIELEMKTSDAGRYTPEVLRKYCEALMKAAKTTLPEGTYIFTSFDQRSLAMMKELDPDSPRLLISGDAPTRKLIDDALKLGCRRVAIVMEKTTRQWVREAQKEGLKVAGWPNRSLADAKLAVGLGVDSLTTDEPSLLAGKTDKPVR